MIRLGLIVNQVKDKELVFTKKISKSIHKNGGLVYIEKKFENDLDDKDIFFVKRDELIKIVDVIICLGGDGTLISVARSVYNYGKPILGINLGTLGFLTEVDSHEFDYAVKNLIKNDYTIKERMILNIELIRDEKVIFNGKVLNDVVVSRESISRIIHLKTFVNDELIYSFTGDGVIISSPTGSTAYSLSAGGPIVDPDVRSIIITPICPHTLSGTRPFVVNSRRVISVALDSIYCESAMLTIDGQIGKRIYVGDKVNVKRNIKKIKLIRFKENNFFNILRKKIYDRGECIGKDEI